MKSETTKTAAIVMLTCALFACGERQEPLDLLFVGGKVIDGTGADRIRADVGVRDDRVVFIGIASAAQPATEIIDVTNLIVAPGFIDVHNHTLDLVVGMSWRGPQINEQFLTQGVTTIVTGADGAWAPDNIRVIKDRLANEGSGVNYACYVGHNGIRRAVMKRDQRREPNPTELEQMKAQTRDGMEQGCVGLSTGLMYEPGMFSKTEEVIALANEVAPFGGTYDSHVRDPVRKLVESDQEAIDIGRAAGIAPKLGHVKAVGLRNRGQAGRIIELVEAARAEGLDVVSDQYPYTSAATHTLYELILFPEVFEHYEKFERGELDEAGMAKIIRDQLGDPSRRDALKDYAENGIDGGFTWIKMTGYGSMRILVSEEDESLEGKNIQLLAEERGVDPFDLIASLILDFQQPLLVTFGSIEEDDVRALLVQPWNMVASDGFFVGPGQLDSSGHPRSTGTFTRVLGHYARDLGLLSLEEAVKKMTSMPADHLGLEGRGRLREGGIADVVVFDPDTVTDNSTWANPNALSDGVEHVLVNGSFAIRDGSPTGNAAGKFVARSRP